MPHQPMPTIGVHRLPHPPQTGDRVRCDCVVCSSALLYVDCALPVMLPPSATPLTFMTPPPPSIYDVGRLNTYGTD